MDPLARHLQESHLHHGLELHTGPLIASFYVDDILLFVRKPEENLPSLMREVVRFGTHSGLAINWSKSEIFALTPTARPVDIEFALKWCTEPPRYLGIYLHCEAAEVIRLNYGPVITHLTEQISRWIKLPLSIAGRIAIIKMIILPKLLYLFLNIPIEDYASLLLLPSRPREIWQPLKDYLLHHSMDETGSIHLQGWSDRSPLPKVPLATY